MDTTVALWTADLMVSSELAGVASRRAIRLETINSAQALMALEPSPRLVVVDLGKVAGDTLKTIFEWCAANSVRSMAYGPHVQVARLKSARDAGCERVVTRGALAEEFAAELAALAD